MSSISFKHPIVPLASLLTIVLGLAFLTLPMIEKQVLRPDEVMTYLSATGHESEFKSALLDDAFPFGNWVPATAWQRYLQPESN